MNHKQKLPQTAKIYKRLPTSYEIQVPRIPFFGFKTWTRTCQLSDYYCTLLTIPRSKYPRLKKELAKTLTVALPMPEHDGQGDTKLYRLAFASRKIKVAIRRFNYGGYYFYYAFPHSNKCSCCEYYLKDTPLKKWLDTRINFIRFLKAVHVQPTDSFFDPLPLSAYSEMAGG